jgi:predicted amidophosphoribosyltransferase
MGAKKGRINIAFKGIQKPNCVNCGAPLNLQLKNCEYCGTSILIYAHLSPNHPPPTPTNKK